MCLANTADNGCQSHNVAHDELQRSIVVQQLDGVVDDVALQRSSAASSFSSLVVSWMAHKSTAEPSYDGLMKQKKNTETSTCPLFRASAASHKRIHRD